MRLAWCLALALVACSPREPFRLALDLPSGAESAVVRAEIGPTTTVAAVDLLTGDGADAFLNGRYGDETVLLTAYTYSVRLGEKGLTAGRLVEVAGAMPLPEPSARLERQATSTSTGVWRPTQHSALDDFKLTTKPPCSEFITEVIPLENLGVTTTVIRDLEVLAGDVVVAAASDGILHTLDVRPGGSVLSTRIPRADARIHAMTIGPDQRIWLSLGATEQSPEPPFDVLVETSTGGFRALPRRTAETYDAWEIKVMAVDPRDPQRLLGLTVVGGLLSFDERTGRWTKLLEPQWNTRVFCYFPREHAPTNQYCGAIHFDGDAILAFDPAGLRAPRRLAGGTVKEEEVVDSPQGGLPTVIKRTQLGLTMLRGDPYYTSILVRDPQAGKWNVWLALASLRMYTVGSVDERRLIIAGPEGSGLELIDQTVCQHLPGLAGVNFGHMAKTDHAFVMSSGDDRYISRNALYVYWVK